MRRTDRASVQWVSVGQYRACFERFADGARFAVHGKRDFSRGYSRPNIVAQGVVGGAGVVYATLSEQLDAALERELIERWHEITW